VLHPRVDTDRFRPAPRNETARAELGWSGRRVVLTVGALQQRKGQDMMIRALPAIARVVPDLLYAVIGEDWEGGLHRRLALDLGVADRVQFLGTPGDATLIACYQQCDLFALPNRQVGWDFEGFGIALLEAQACGTPVVCGASGGAPEAVDVPNTGLVLDCTAPDALASTVSALLADPAMLHRMSSAATDWARAKFAWKELRPEAIAGMVELCAAETAA